MAGKITTPQGRQLAIRAACELMRRAGCTVNYETRANGYQIDVALPADDGKDIHTQRLELARETGR